MFALIWAIGPGRLMSVGGLKTTVNVLYARGEMFNHEALITRWQQQPEPYGAIDYGVIVKPITPNPGELYWRCLGAYHLLPEQNRGGRSLQPGRDAGAGGGLVSQPAGRLGAVAGAGKVG